MSGLLYLINRTSSRSGRLIVPVMGVFLGVFSFTVVLSIMGGMVQDIHHRLLGHQPHITVDSLHPSGTMEANLEVLKAISEVPGVLQVTPFQSSIAIARAGERSEDVTLLGLGEQGEGDASGLTDYFLRTPGHENIAHLGEPVADEEGSFFPAVLGRSLKRALRASEGERITLVSPSATDGPFGVAHRQLPVIVSNSIEVGGRSHYDSRFVIANLEASSRLFDLEGLWHGVYIRIKDPSQAREVASAVHQQIEPLFEDKSELRVKSWMEANQALLRALALERWGMRVVLGMVILVACFSIGITLVLVVRKKTREMAILRSMGLSRRRLGWLLVLNGGLVGVVGLTLGIGLGLSFLFIAANYDIPLLTQAYGGKFPVLINWPEIVVASFGSVFLAMFASLWPALEVMRIDVVATLSQRNQ